MRAFLFLFTTIAFAQLDSNSVTVTATRNSTVQPDQIVFSVVVNSPLNVALSDIVAAVQGAGITLSNFNGVSTSNSYIPSSPQRPVQTLSWTFALPVSFDKLKDTVNNLNNVQQAVAKNNNGLTMSFSVQSTQVSQQLAQSQTCPLADLFSDARTQAQKLAGGAGMNAGSILAMQSSVSTTLPAAGVYLDPYGSNYSGACTVTVKFALK